jgi:hypothetical protein
MTDDWNAAIREAAEIAESYIGKGTGPSNRLFTSCAHRILALLRPATGSGKAPASARVEEIRREFTERDGRERLQSNAPGWDLHDDIGALLRELDAPAPNAEAMRRALRAARELLVEHPKTNSVRESRVMKVLTLIDAALALPREDGETTMDAPLVVEAQLREQERVLRDEPATPGIYRAAPPAPTAREALEDAAKECDRLEALHQTKAEAIPVPADYNGHTDRDAKAASQGAAFAFADAARELRHRAASLSDGKGEGK